MVHATTWWQLLVPINCCMGGLESRPSGYTTGKKSKITWNAIDSWYGTYFVLTIQTKNYTHGSKIRLFLTISHIHSKLLSTSITYIRLYTSILTIMHWQWRHTCKMQIVEKICEIEHLPHRNRVLFLRPPFSMYDSEYVNLVESLLARIVQKELI